MLYSVLTAVLLAQNPILEMPFTEMSVQNGQVVVEGKKLQASASRIQISPDGSKLELWGTDDTPAVLVFRQSGNELSGKRIVYARTEDKITVEVIGAGKISGPMLIKK